MTRALLQQALNALSADHHFGDYEDLCNDIRAELAKPERKPVHQYRIPFCTDWYDGFPDNKAAYETRTLYAEPPSPPGYKLVPMEATDEMIDAACDEDCEAIARAAKEEQFKRAGVKLEVYRVSIGEILKQQYKLMLAAAPEAPHD